MSARFGTTTWAWVWSAVTSEGVTVTVPTLPLLSRVTKVMPVDAVNPVPTRVMSCATSAEALVESVGVPLCAVATIAVSAGGGGDDEGVVVASKTTPSVEATRSCLEALKASPAIPATPCDDRSTFCSTAPPDLFTS